jgi:hypothetical protein
MRELSPDGTIKDMTSLLKEQGFVVGAYIVRKSDKTQCMVKEITADSVVLEGVGSPGIVSLPFDTALQGQWSRYNPKHVESQQAVSPRVSTSGWFLNLNLSTTLHLKMCSLAVQHEAILSGLKVSLKPKAVVATKAFKKNKLVLVPFSSKVNFREDEAPSKSTLQIHVSSSKAFFWLQPMTSPPKGADDMIVPFWFVQTDPKDFNMEMHWVKIDDYKLPVARNTRSIKADEPLILLKAQDPKAVTEPLFTPKPDEEPQKKRRRSS